jgi:inorganic pyrophosphatase
VEREVVSVQHMDPWRDLPTGPQPPDVVHCVVEIPRGSRNKYEYDKESGVITLSRVLYSAMFYPGDYGLIPRTCSRDGDALDIMVIVSEPTFPGCVIQARPIGVFHMLDRGEQDDKILAVPATDPTFAGYQSLADVPPHFLRQVSHFFQTYKQLENIEVEPRGWEDADVARECILEAIRLYRDKRTSGRP